MRKINLVQKKEKLYNKLRMDPKETKMIKEEVNVLFPNFF